MSGEPLGPTGDIPFAVFVYPPNGELELRKQVGLSVTRLQNAGLRIEVVDLGALLWHCLERHPDGPDGLFRAEAGSRELEPLLREAHQLVGGGARHEPGPLEKLIIAAVDSQKPDIVFLLRAGELFPIYRTSALLERLIGHVAPRTILFYPGELTGATGLRFMGVCEPSPNYRPTIFA